MMRDIFEDFLDRTTVDDFSDEANEVTVAEVKEADPTVYHWRFLFNMIPYVNAHPNIEGLIMRVRNRLERVLDMTPDVQEHSSVFVLSTYKYFRENPTDFVQVVDYDIDNDILSGFESWKQTTVFMFACNCEFQSVKSYLRFINSCSLMCQWQKVTAEQPMMAVDFSNGSEWEYKSTHRNALNFSMKALRLAFNKDIEHIQQLYSRVSSIYSFCLNTFDADRLRVFKGVSELFQYDYSDEGMSNFLKTYQSSGREYDDRKRVLRFTKKQRDIKERLDNIAITGDAMERIGTRGILYLQQPYGTADGLQLKRGFHEQDVVFDYFNQHPAVNFKWKMWTWHCGLDFIYIAYLGPVYDRQNDKLYLVFLGFQSQIHYDYADEVLADLMGDQYDDDWFDDFHELLVDVANKC